VAAMAQSEIRSASIVAAPNAPDLAGIVRSLVDDSDLWRPRVRHELHRRYFERLVATADYEAWLICWDLGQMTLLHDHGGSTGAFMVVDGALLEDFARPGAKRLRQRRISRGQLRSFGPNYLHNLVNAGPALATSIHAYAPRLTTMTFYAVLPDGVVPTRAMPVETPEPASPL
jgi:predicted metal-dependent enzyme (double-stranded beta helix superfamily)